MEPPGILAKFCNITSEIDPEAILRSFSTDQTSNQTIGSLTGDDSVNRSTIGQSAGITSSLLGGGEGGGERPSSRGSVVSGDVSASPHNTTEEGMYMVECVCRCEEGFCRFIYTIEKEYQPCYGGVCNVAVILISRQ